MMHWNIGCSGFHYKHWRGTFYPEKLAMKNWFNYYGEHFDTLELNVTFYRFPQLSVLEKWHQESPSYFRFAVKAPRVITHFKKFNDTERMLSDFYNTVRDGLKEKCGCCLFQFPPNYNYTEEKLGKILKGLDLDFPNVLEFRHESWWNENVFRTLSEHNITFCGMSHPTLPKDIITNTSLFYYRFHGTEQLYASNYTHAQLTAFAKQVTVQDGIRNAYVFFNNDINTFAVHNAKDLKEITATLEKNG
jgi:uncharacterized protein YecE (DUF72 family)